MKHAILAIGIAVGTGLSTPATAQLLGVPADDNRVGRALASGDFDGDGYLDLAIGNPGEPVKTLRTGGVHVLYGTADGLTNARQQLWTIETLGTPEEEESTEVGLALASGDFNGDGRDDLAIQGKGVTNGGPRGGVVYVVHGSPTGLSRVSGSQAWHLDRDDICFDTNRGGCADPPSRTGDDFGHALAAGDFDGDGYDQLAIGIPGFSLEGLDYGGAVLVLQSDGRGLIADDHQFITQNQPEAIVGGTETNDNFARALESGDINADGFDDLAIGSPFESVESNTVNQGGAVNLLYGSGNGLTELGNQFFVTRDSGGEDPEDFDWFGSAIAIGHFSRNESDSPRTADLTVGAPGHAVNGIPGAGLVSVWDGSIDGLLPADKDHVSGADLGIFPIVTYDRFGGTLENGDFDGDGYDDLAVAKTEVNSSTGAFYTVPGGASGLQLEGAAYWQLEELVPPKPLAPPENPEFGFSFAAGDFNMDGYADLAVGAPAKDRSIAPLVDFHATRAGAVVILYGSADGLREETVQIWYQNIPAAAPDLVSPADNSAIFIGGDIDNPSDPSTPLAVVWTHSSDPDSMTVTYQWQISSNEAFDDTLAEFDATESDDLLNQLIVTHGELAGIMSDAGVALDETVEWYHRIVVHDGVAGTPSPPFRITLRRGTIVATSADGVPDEAAILEVYPNPTSNQTTISFKTTRPARIQATLHDVSGRTVRKSFVDGTSPGRHTTDLDLSDLPGGVYLYRLDGGGLRGAGTIVVLR